MQRLTKTQRCLQTKVNNVITIEDAVKVVHEFDQIIKNKKVVLYS